MPTSYEIYQAYLCGPVAVLRLFEQALGTQAIYGMPTLDMQQCTIESLSEEIDRLQSQIARLKEELRAARSDKHRLRRREVGQFQVRATINIGSEFQTDPLASLSKLDASPGA